MVRSVSHPLDGSPSQSPQPGSHAPMPQVALVHAGDACGGVGQALPQLPQLTASDWKSFAQPGSGGESLRTRLL